MMGATDKTFPHMQTFLLNQTIRPIRTCKTRCHDWIKATWRLKVLASPVATSLRWYKIEAMAFLYMSLRWIFKTHVETPQTKRNTNSHWLRWLIRTVCMYLLDVILSYQKHSFGLSEVQWEQTRNLVKSNRSFIRASTATACRQNNLTFIFQVRSVLIGCALNSWTKTSVFVSCYWKLRLDVTHVIIHQQNRLSIKAFLLLLR